MKEETRKVVVLDMEDKNQATKVYQRFRTNL